MYHGRVAHCSVDPAHLIRRAARQHPAAGRIEDGTRALTLAECVDRAERLANAFDGLGVPEGAAVAILSENRTQYVELDFGLLLGRRVRVALNARLHVDDFEFMLRDSGAELLIHSGDFADAATRLSGRLGIPALNLDAPDGYEAVLAASSPVALNRPASEDDVAWISYTSGTTGQPKGVMLSRHALRHVAFNLLLELDRVRPGEQLVLAQPLSHGAGYFVLPFLISGAGLVIQRKFDPEAMAAATRRPEVRFAKIVPAMLPPLLELPEPLHVDSLIYGGSPIGLPLLEASVDRFGPVLVQIYGQTEAPMTLTILRCEEHVGDGDRRMSAGRPWRSVALEVRGEAGTSLAAGEIGEIHISGDHMMLGYRGMPEATAQILRDGWLATRDMGYVDEEGYVFLMGRRDEMIISGGYNIAPREVERVLLDHPAVLECVVFGSSDARWGEAVHAAAVVGDGGVSAAHILEWARPRLGFRTPKRITIVDSIPRNAYGKVDRAQLQGSIS